MEINMKKKIISVCVTFMTIMTMAACGNASQATTNTQASMSGQVVKNEPQKVTVADTKFPEATKAAEKNTVAPTNATTEAPEVTTVTPTEAAGIDYTGFGRTKTIEVNSNDVGKTKSFITEFGIRNISKNESISLNSILGFTELPTYLKEYICIEVAEQLSDFSSDIDLCILKNNYGDMQLAFKYDVEKNEFCLMVKN